MKRTKTVLLALAFCVSITAIAADLLPAAVHTTHFQRTR